MHEPVPPPLLNRLFRYRQTEARTPTEDFLSEILADLLGRAPQEQAVAILSNCLIPRAMASCFRAACGAGRLHVRTQVRLPAGKILDILVECEGRPLLVIENKIRAGFQRHARKDAKGLIDASGGEAEQDSQLVTYGSWLRDADKPQGWPGVLTVLTHATVAPSDFCPASIDRYGAVPHLCHWRDLHGKLRTLVGRDDEGSSAPAWVFLARELCRFLETRTMASSDLSLAQIAGINVSMEPTRRADACFDEVGAGLLHRFSKHLVPKGQNSNHDAANSRIWGWTYFTGPERVYVGYGIYFVPLAGELERPSPSLPEQEHAFVAVGSDQGPLRVPGHVLPDGWSRVNDDWCVIKPVPLSARGSGERFPGFLLALVEAEWPTLLAVYDAHRASVPPKGE